MVHLRARTGRIGAVQHRLDAAQLHRLHLAEYDGTATFSPRGPRTFSILGGTIRINYTAFNGIVTPTNLEDNVANVHTVPDPYYVTSGLERTTDVKAIKFVNLPAKATIRIYTTSGVLVQVLEHTTRPGAPRPGTSGTGTTSSWRAACTSTASKTPIPAPARSGG